MNLATRCTSCGTVFRVVQDQLKVSEGWVRCGRCNEVFNATDGLFDLERGVTDEPAQLTRSAPLDEALPYTPEPVPVRDDAATSTLIDLDVDHVAPSDPLFEPFDEQLAAAYRPAEIAPSVEPASHAFQPAPGLSAKREDEARSTPATRIDERDRLEFPDARFDSELRVGEDTSSPPETEAPEEITSGLVSPEPEEPHFVLHAQRRARWQTPRMVALQLGAAALCLVLLGLQYAHHFRDQLAARWPATAPVFSAWCSLAACKLEAPRRVDDLVVENTSLVRAPLPDAFKVSVVLRNRGNVAVMAPFVDLTLTDAAGLPVARRMLSPRDFMAPTGPVKPGLEAPWQLVLVTPAANRVTGYTVEVFYP